MENSIVSTLKMLSSARTEVDLVSIRIIKTYLLQYRTGVIRNLLKICFGEMMGILGDQRRPNPYRKPAQKDLFAGKRMRYLS